MDALLQGYTDFMVYDLIDVISTLSSILLVHKSPIYTKFSIHKNQTMSKRRLHIMIGLRGETGDRFST